MRIVTALTILLALPLAAFADRPEAADVIAAGSVHRALATSPVDTVILFGGPASGDGKFQDDLNPSLPDWEGWRVHETSAETPVWKVSRFNSPTGTPAIWLGTEMSEFCTGLVRPGYANNWSTGLVWEGAVTDPLQPTTVAVAYLARWETEPGHDYLAVQVERAGVWSELVRHDGLQAETVADTLQFTLAPGEYGGPAGDLVRVRFYGYTDDRGSDNDCEFLTAAGLAQIDDIRIEGDNGLSDFFEDFESGYYDMGMSVEHEGTHGQFAGIWTGLQAPHPCYVNQSPQVAFIDDGNQESCSPGSVGQTWTYGPGGFVTNATGGCISSWGGVSNEVWSPPIALADASGNPLPERYTGLLLEYDVLVHNPIRYLMLPLNIVRFSQDGGVTWGAWQSGGYYFAEEVSTIRRSKRLDQARPAGATHVMIGLGLHDLLTFDFFPPDNTPAPYFDNVALRAFEAAGPVVTLYETLALQDNFPARNDIDPANPGVNDVACDIAWDLVDIEGPKIVPGDTVVAYVLPGQSDAELTGPPRLHYRMRANPLFDAYRAQPTAGSVIGRLDSADGRWSFELPDEDFLYPGDILHYYIWAEDEVDGVRRVTTVPEDLSAFAAFPDESLAHLDWDPHFAMHALPGITGLAPETRKRILFWDDGLEAEARRRWELAFARNGVVIGGPEVDVYTTQAASTGLSNGLGSRATADLIAGYDLIICASGRRKDLTIVSENCQYPTHDKSDDVGLLLEALASGTVVAVFGQNVAEDLSENQGAAGDLFLSQSLGAEHVADRVADVAPLDSPAVLAGIGSKGAGQDQGFPWQGLTYAVPALCPLINQSDGVGAVGAAVLSQRWLDAAGDPVVIPDVGSGLVHVGAGGKTVIFPHAFADVTALGDDGQGEDSALLRAQLLHAVADWAGTPLPDTPSGVAAGVRGGILRMSASPNPFNPEVELRFTAASASRAVVEIFDVRGAKVRTLLDARVHAGPHLASWDGRDDRGAAQASGVYFARVKVGEEQRVEKLALVR
ncbi:hypothetical protein KDK88_06830 [bacterium]|nr:hypothetical protein [bacterium]HPF35429.1 FlgD immunoglobulin-like domain containing protein [Candidatus Krumholzibacteria bacterium]